MLRTNTDKQWLPLYEALASEVRLRILDLLAEQPMNVKDLAASLGLSSAIVTMHIKKLEKATLIATRMIRKEGGTHKICSLATRSIEIMLPNGATVERAHHETKIPIGHYTAFNVYPTCGLATKEQIIGQYDDPRYFLDPDRMHARILWFSKGFVEYTIPNYSLHSQQLEEIQISMELSSEAPGINEQWPSDIRFYMNGICLGEWTSPGDYGHTRGRLTPSWWLNNVNQYGLLKVIRIDQTGTYMDGKQISDVTIDALSLHKKFWTLRFAVEEDSRHVGGLSLFGEGFGNYNQDIELKAYYSEA
ncbi:ArsR/SmtB family transcription factor [Paenibacillus agricola]|uniref:ArsR family transcriptional regulator n=1 Tax=Paenibacillus agricola TaxID=2716264 RepID=A0ABX0J547_9BACL|nr:ArsR family transcriptional regulator [Paenibacillus agricola]NHN28935.1 ArsR family transcriptional regulator [Paenibacillus agricola]